MSDMLERAGFSTAKSLHEETRPLPNKPIEKKETRPPVCFKCKRYRTLAPNFAFCATCSALMAKGNDRKERLDKLGLTEDEAWERVGWTEIQQTRVVKPVKNRD